MCVLVIVFIITRWLESNSRRWCHNAAPGNAPVTSASQRAPLGTRRRICRWRLNCTICVHRTASSRRWNTSFTEMFTCIKAKADRGMTMSLPTMATPLAPTRVCARSPEHRISAMPNSAHGNGPVSGGIKRTGFVRVV